MEKENIPILHFLYPTISEVFDNELLSALLFKSSIESFSDTYLIVRDKRNQMVSEIRSIHVLYSNLITSGNKYIDQYNELIVKYGFELIDKLFIKDENIISNSLLKTINFAMNEMYKVDEMFIQFNLYKEGIIKHNMQRFKETSDIINILYYVLQENFIIIENNLVDKTAIIHFKKRR